MMLAFWLALAWLLYRSESRPQAASRGVWASLYPVLIIAALLFVDTTNLRIVRADVLYKQGLKADEQANWDTAIHYYQRAVDLTPREDYYYLFLGRALLERAKIEMDAAQRDALFQRALDELETAQRLNPRNTDHTANLARLYRTWAEFAADAALRQERLQVASTIYDAATDLSPHSAQILNEWGLVYHLLGDYDAALAAYDRSLALDREFPQTYLLRSDVFLARQEWSAAVDACRQATALDPALVQAWSAMGYAHSQMEDWENAIAANLRVYELAPSDYNTLKNLAILYDHAAQAESAISFAEQAMQAAPEQERPTMQAFLDDLRQRNGKDRS